MNKFATLRSTGTILTAFFFATRLLAQQPSWSASWDAPKVFIENKGQFHLPGKSNTESDVLFAYDNGENMIFFTPNSVTYTFVQRVFQKEKEEHELVRDEKDWAEKEAEEKRAGLKSDYVTMTWANASPNVQVLTESEVSDYYNYSFMDNGVEQSISDAHAYKKLIYKELYPHIDVTFEFHPVNGIKYSITLHPGADISQVQMIYSHADKVSINRSGDVTVPTLFGDIIDHAPVTYYADDQLEQVKSAFTRNGKTVSFSLGEYDHARSIVIDPWTITGTGFTNSNRIWECERDNSGNVYLYGGDTPLRLKKYNSAGTLQWTYSTPWDSANYWLGSLIVDNSGNSFCTSGSNGEIRKVSTAGAVVWSNNPNGPFGPLYEYWHLAFNCDQTQLVVGGTRMPSPFATSQFRGAVMNINLTNGAIISYGIVGWIAGLNIKEARTICSSPNGNYYFLTLDSVGCINSSMTLQWKTVSGYNFSYGSPTYSIKGNLGLSSIRATANFIYTQNGTTVHKRNISNGAIVATAAIPGGLSSSGFGGNAPGNSGLDIDDCGNVYVGSGNQVVKYDANLNQLATAATSSAVYDVAVTTGGEVIACGNNFAVVVNMSSCNPVQPICQPPSTLSVTSASTNPSCFGQCTGTATVTASGGTSPYTYLWSNSQTTATATGLCAGTYSCTITDNVGATTTATVTITQPTAVTASANVTANVTCNGACNGTASGSGSGGTGSLSYSWSNSQTGTSATSLCAGNYTLTVTDANGCPATSSITVTQPAVLSASISSSTNTSCGNNNGSATAGATGGTTTYTYNWTPTGGNAATANGLAAGNYTCTITDANGCTSTATTNIAASSGPSASVQSTGNVSCFSGTNGTATVSASGAPTLTYNWAPSGGNAATANGLAAGNYTCTITDGNGCTTTQSVSITEPTQLTSTITATSNATCGNNDGSATVAGGGGTGAYTYNWSPSGGNAATANNLAVGSYTATITDANGCTSSATATINGSGGPTVNLQSSSDVSCFGGSNGAATVNASGTGTLSYSWAPAGGNAASATNLNAGTYSVTVTDGNGCTTIQTVTITEPTQLNATTSTVSATCGNNDGSATVNVSGGTSAYTYSWTSGGTGATENNLAVGTYTVTITDANSCTVTATASISSSGGPGVSVQSTTDVSCFGGNNGSATVNATGSGTLTYNWTPAGGNAATASGLNAGTYTVTVTDSTGCATTQSVTITEPTQLATSTSTVSATCGNSNGSATVTPSGGVGSYTYSWTSGGSGATENNLAAGNYTVTVTDGNGCTTSASVTISNLNGPVVALQSSSDVSCFGASDGTATVNATGNGPFSYSWSPSGGNAATANNLGAGSYTVTITDNSGCTATQTLTLTQPTAIGATTSSSAENCSNNDGTASVAASGGTPGYSYSWNTGDTTAAISGLASGNYSVTITDANGCTSTATVSVGLNATASADAGTAVTITQGQSTTLNGTGNGTFSWSPGSSVDCSTCQNPVASPTITTTYTLSVTDSLGCTATDTVTVFVDILCGELYLPNAFSPNGDHENDVLYVRGNCIAVLDFAVYNRWGEQVFETTNPALGWDGTWRGKPCEAAVFTYYLRATLQDGTQIEKQGSISLVK